MPDQDIVNIEFPGNSRRLKKQETSISESKQPKKLDKVTSGTRRKKGLLDRFSETFFGDDAKSVADYVLWDVLIPAAKNTISEMVSTGIEMLLFGETKSRRGLNRDKDRSYVSYDRMYRDRERERPERRPASRRERLAQEFDDIVIDSKSQAEEVLSLLVDQIEDYGQATVGDFYDLVDITPEFTDNKWGWDDRNNLSRAYVERVREGYIIVLPKPILLN